MRQKLRIISNIENYDVVKLTGKYFHSRNRRLKELRRLGDAARDDGQYHRAASLYEDVLACSPEDGPIHVQCGHMHKEAGDSAKAEAHYLRALLLMPDDADLHLQLGHFYKVSHRLYEAIAYYKRTVALMPEWNAPALELESLREQMQKHLQADNFLPVPNPAPVAQPYQPAGSSHQDRAPNRLTPGARVSMEQIQASGLFDSNWYRKRYPDIAASQVDPLAHFANDGIIEGRIPGPGFEPEWYRETYQDVERAGVDPFTHYVLVGQELGFKPAGPPPYQRWISAFDTLADGDFEQINQHIAQAGLEQPIVIMAIDQVSASGAVAAIRSLRRQRLAPKKVLLCCTLDCPNETLRSVRAVAGSDPLFQVLMRSSQVPRMPSGKGPVILMDAGAELREHALYMLVQACTSGISLAYADHDRLEDGIRTTPTFKPDPSPELLQQLDFLGPFVALAGGIDTDRIVTGLMSGRATVAGIIRATCVTADPASVAHVPFVLFHDHAMSRPKPDVTLPVALNDDALPTVSVIIPTRDKVELLRACVESLWAETEYPRDKLEIIVVDNRSARQETLDYFDYATEQRKLRVVTADFPFNYAKINNIAVTASRGELIVLLNNDTEIQDPVWLRTLASYAMQPDVGAVGPKLLYPDGTIQHAGVVLSIGGVAAHAHLGLPHDSPGSMNLAQVTHEVAAVTGACLAIRRAVFDAVGGLNENLPVAFNDVLLCLACLDHGYRNLYVHSVWVRHFESKTRGVDDTDAKIDLFIREARYARSHHRALFKRDPYYSPNLSLDHETFYMPAFPPRCRYPWRDHARQGQKCRKMLILSSTFAESSDVGIIASMQARYLTQAGYDVRIGSPQREANIHVGAARHVVVKRAETAACYAVQNDVDGIIVHGPAFAKVARLLGAYPPTLLYGHQDHSAALASAGERREARIELELAVESFDTIVAVSTEVGEKFGRSDVVCCPPGSDRLGNWSLATLPLREKMRMSKGWTTVFVIVAGGFPAEPENARRMLASLDALAGGLNMKDVRVTAISRTVALSSSDRVTVFNQPTAGETATIFAAADLYLDLNEPGRSTLDAIEAAALGTVSKSFEIPATRGGLTADTATLDAALMRLVEIMDGINPHSHWHRQSHGRPWGEALAQLEETIARTLSDRSLQKSGVAQTFLSDRKLIELSGLFDVGTYLAQYPGDKVVAQDPVGHYLAFGWREGRQPSPLFHNVWYLARYPQVAQAEVNPLIHYLRHPTGTCDPNNYFDNKAYIAAYPTAPATRFAPFVHYLQHGSNYVGPHFDSGFYTATYSDAKDSGIDPLLHFLRVGEPEGRLPLRPKKFDIDVYDTDDLSRVFGQQTDWYVPTPAGVVDVWTAARFCIGALSSSKTLRARFPLALSEGASGGFAQWLAKDGRKELGLSDKAMESIGALFIEDISAPIMQTFLTRQDLRSAFPLGLTPVGLAEFVKWLFGHELQINGRLRIEQIRWFAVTMAENPQMQLVRTYQFTPMLQALFPDGLTLFGREAFAAWLSKLCDLRDDWLDSSTWPLPSTAADQIRQAYDAREAWQREHPAPFASKDAAHRFVTWLRSPQAEMPKIARTWLSGLSADALVTELVADGVNMLGHFCYPSGLRTSAESLVAGYREVGRMVNLRNVWVQPQNAESGHSAYIDPEVFDVSIIHVQPEPFFDQAYARANLSPRRQRTYRIGYWYWELDTVPASWRRHAQQVDEIWTATRFVGDAFRAQFDKPVCEIIPGVELPPFAPKPRSYFGLPEDSFLFLFTFHMMSIMERKNPLGLIQAFRAAFPKGGPVGLVLKTSFGENHPSLMRELHEAAADSAITIINSVYTQEEVIGLMQACDSYVSLHRSEGYGLTMAEAMLLGKPVIATGYSGNLDFMTPETGLLVDYDLTTLDRTIGPYEVGTRWAQPSIRHAADCMRQVYDNRDWARGLGSRAQASLRKLLSHKTCGARMSARLDEIKSIRSAQSTGLQRPPPRLVVNH